MRRPQPISEEVVSAINRLLAGSDRFRNWSDTAVQEVEMQLERLKKSEARAAYLLYTELAAICGDVEKSEEFYRKAWHLDRREAAVSFWVALANMGYIAKAREYSEEVLDPKNGRFQSRWENAASKGQVQRVVDAIPEALKTYPEFSKVDVSKLMHVSEVMKMHSLKDDDLISVLDTMGEVQREHHIMFHGLLASVIKIVRPPEGDPYLYCNVIVDVDVTELHEMNRKLVKKVVSRLPDGRFPNGLTAAFVQPQEVNHQAAA